MKISRMLSAAGTAAMVLALAGCWNDNDTNDVPVVPPPPPVTAVPDSAGVSGAAFISFIMSLSGSDETSEPLTIKDTFAVPPDEGNEPTPLT